MPLLAHLELIAASRAYRSRRISKDISLTQIIMQLYWYLKVAPQCQLKTTQYRVSATCPIVYPVNGTDATCWNLTSTHTTRHYWSLGVPLSVGWALQAEKLFPDVWTMFFFIHFYMTTTTNYATHQQQTMPNTKYTNHISDIVQQQQSPMGVSR